MYSCTPYEDEIFMLAIVNSEDDNDISGHISNKGGIGRIMSGWVSCSGQTVAVESSAQKSLAGRNTARTYYRRL